MVIYNTAAHGGVIIRTAWDEHHCLPVELHVTIDHTYVGNGISERLLRSISFAAMRPQSMQAMGSLRTVGDWIAQHKPSFRQRPEDPRLFYAHVALFVVLVAQEGERGAINTLANYAAVRPHKAREWIATARRLGMLTSSTAHAGRVYGVLTKTARETLSESYSSIENLEAA